MDPECTNATLVRRQDLTDGLSIVWIRPDAGHVPHFHPGQFFRLGLPKKGPDGQPATLRGRIRMTRRAYSVASSPLERDSAEFFVVRIEEGELTPKLWDIEVGGRLWMEEEAKGEFSLDAAPRDTDVVMIATGTGVAPFISMLRTYRGQGRWRRFVLIQGARIASDLGYQHELEEVCRADATVTYIPLTTREPETSDWAGLRGRVQTVLEPRLYERLVGVPLDPARCHVFLCGNPEMIDTVETLLTARGFVTDSRNGLGNVHFERYW